LEVSNGHSPKLKESRQVQFPIKNGNRYYKEITASSNSKTIANKYKDQKVAAPNGPSYSKLKLDLVDMNLKKAAPA
jgi:hypothetical protein